MNLLSRAKSFTSKRIFHLRPVNVLQQSNFYGTRTTGVYQKTVQSTKPKSEKSSTFSQPIAMQTAELTLGPKPGEIPFQLKVSNFVNLIGHVKPPIIHFKSAVDGKLFAAFVISSEYCNGRESLPIPVLFEGDLANTVANYVKENDYVFVCGQLSVDHLGILTNESVGKLHIVGENLNFVRRGDKSVSDYQTRPSAVVEERINVVDHNENFRFGDGEKSVSDYQTRASAVVEERINVVDHNENFRFGEDYGFQSGTEKAELEFKQEKVEEKSVNKKKDEEDTWREVLYNPKEWWDFRNNKAKGLVNEKHPDFKHKENGTPLWVSSAPKWVLHGIAKLEFDVKFIKPKQADVSGGTYGTKQNSKDNGSSWKDLVENPEKWWDNRVQKRSANAPDFRHKETGEGLWLNTSPGWALSRLPQLKEGRKSSFA